MSATFHLSFFVTELQATRQFYGEVLGCAEGHSGPNVADFSFYGHQLTCHVAPSMVRPASQIGLDGNHFGLILKYEEFQSLAARLQTADVQFLKAPESQNQGTDRERWKMIFVDPSGNAIEIKSYRSEAMIFG